MKQGEGIRGPTTVSQGGTVTVEVGPNDTTVDVSAFGSGTTSTYPVDPGKQANIPVPPNTPPGTILHITVGAGLRMRIIEVLVVAAE
jgi:hypothetical protein